MRRLVVKISEYMSMSAAQKGVTVEAEKLYAPVARYLQEAESLLSRDVVESFSPRDWAILFSNAKANDIQPKDVLMQMLSDGMQSSVKTISKLKRLRTAEATVSRPRPTLRLVK